MKKVLFCLSSLSRSNGVSKFIMTYYEDLIREGFQVDFLIIYDKTDKVYEDLINKNNSKIYFIEKSNKLKRVSVTKDSIIKVLKNNDYDTVHVNLVDQYACGCVLGAKEMNINNIVYHAHNPLTLTKLLFVRNILNYICIKNSTKLVACSNMTGKSVFKNRKFKVINNALNFDDYKYDIKYRNKIRKELNIEDRFVVGIVGRICDQKNYKYVVDVLKRLVKIKSNVLLLWVGSGNKDYEFKELINSNNLNNNVLLLGNRTDVNKLYSVFDTFILPSKYEGLGIVLLESQASGLHTITSKNVPFETKQTSIIDYLNTSRICINSWVNSIIETTEIDRKEYCSILKASDFSLEKNVTSLVELYSGDIKC